MAQLAQTDLVFEQGDTPDLVIGPVTIKNAATGVASPIDLTVAGTKMWVTAKRSKSDADNAAAFQRTLGVGGGPGGITADSPATAEKNYATARIPAAETEDEAPPTELYYDVQLEEPSGRKTTLARGRVEIVVDVTNA